MNTIYSCSSSYDEDRPNIDFQLPVNAQNDWLTVYNVLAKELPVEAWPDISVWVNDADATAWDSFCAFAPSDLYSERFVAAFGNGLKDFTLLPATVNGEQYYYLRNEHPVDCFDRSAAVFKVYPSDPSKILKYDHFAFTPAVPRDAVFFCIPETLELLATNLMAEQVRSHQLLGISLEPLP